jgi:TonB family protein
VASIYWCFDLLLFSYFLCEAKPGEAKSGQATEMLELRPNTQVDHQPIADKQPRRLQIALALLLTALIVVLVKDREFWFGSTESVEADSSEVESAPKPVSAQAKPALPVIAGRTAIPISKSKSKVPPQSSIQTAVQTAAVLSRSESANSDAPIVATQRVVLPSLDVEVVAGDKHSTLHPGSNITKVEIPGASNSVSRFTASVASFTTNAADRERLGAGNIPDQSMEATYPLLAEHMKVQGSVVLQAIVGADGGIEDLHVLSGPAILTSAAQQAVRQWRFKPYLLNGQPVETKARITVNFSIRVSDNTANAS